MPVIPGTRRVPTEVSLQVINSTCSVIKSPECPTHLMVLHTSGPWVSVSPDGSRGPTYMGSGFSLCPYPSTHVCGPDPGRVIQGVSGESVHWLLSNANKRQRGGGGIIKDAQIGSPTFGWESIKHTTQPRARESSAADSEL
jgi:hypothetical protein